MGQEVIFREQPPGYGEVRKDHATGNFSTFGAGHHLCCSLAAEVLRLRAELAAKAITDTAPITEEWAATVRGDETLIFQDTVLDKWVLNCKGREGWVYAYVDTQGQVLGILNAVKPQKAGE